MIRVGCLDSVRTITLDRPAQRNALTPGMLDGLADAFEHPADEARAVVVLGAGRVFCAGFDLSLCRAEPDGSAMRALLTGLSRAIRAMRNCPLPIVLGVHGAAIAGGCALLGGADIVVSHADAKLGYPVVKLGISPAVSAPTLGAQVSGGSMRQLLLDPELISGSQAQAMGLVHELVADRDSVGKRAVAIARALAEKPPGGVQATKSLLIEQDQLAGKNELTRGLDASLGLVGSAEERVMLDAAWGAR